jgi:outer membrane protein OmpA-like peptidoglycan-associated protein
MNTVLASWLLLLAGGPLLAQAQDVAVDCDGCKDATLLARYPGSVLYGADQKAFEEAVLPIGPSPPEGAEAAVTPKTVTLSGKRTRLFYLAPKERSALEVFANYRQALQKLGMSELWSCTEAACGAEFLSQSRDVLHLGLSNTPEASLGFVLGERPRYVLSRPQRPQGDLHIMVLAADLTDQQRPAVFVVIVESKPMEAGLVTVSAGMLEQRLASDGKVVLYGIPFDFDKAVIRPESKPQLAQIAELLRAQSELKLTITGHTDNQGAADYNQKLSERRAQAIVAELSGGFGIAADRLSAQGIGGSAPVASNDTEEGRSRNRRVELIKR